LNPAATLYAGSFPVAAGTTVQARLLSGGVWSAVTEATFTSLALPGDYNGNGIVDAADYTVWRDGGSPDSSQTGYDVWKANFGNTSVNTAAASFSTASLSTESNNQSSSESARLIDAAIAIGPNVPSAILQDGTRQQVASVDRFYDFEVGHSKLTQLLYGSPERNGPWRPPVADFLSDALETVSKKGELVDTTFGEETKEEIKIALLDEVFTRIGFASVLANPSLARK